MKEIKEILKRANIDEKYFELYGKFKAKIALPKLDPKGKLILVTAINPTSAGEGKTTISIGLTDSLNSIGCKTALAIREPSMGPVFGRKGGATGSNHAQILPAEDINLHFNGDIHAITSANNLISAIIDNDIYWGNSLRIKKVIWKRCLDMNDRSLRDLNVKIKKDIQREEHFQITAASEIMAILSLSENLEDLEQRLNKAIIAIDKEDKPIYLSSLKITGSILALLKDAIKPNFVQTKEGSPVFIHCGPFANIAHGCNSVVATKTALTLFDTVITEAGFGSDLGMEKFLDLKCRSSMLWPNMVVLVATIRALKMHGGQSLASLHELDLDSLKKGILLLEKHISNINKFKLNYVVALNHFDTDHKEEINFVNKWAKENNHPFAFADVWAQGSSGGKELARVVKDVLNKRPTPCYFIYDEQDSIETKINKIAKDFYGASKVNFSELAKSKIKYFNENGLANKFVCMAKTPDSITDDPKKLGVSAKWELNIKDLAVSNGAGFIIAYCGDIVTMPGLPKIPAARNIYIKNNQIVGLK